ncbi:hypothetical protein BYT27DRAFT_7109784 [Phlegmacium glaucopus]|nr:hypothetical protein BYT27DRAFT_7109784 [Phlegmacium glaucopus]
MKLTENETCICESCRRSLLPSLHIIWPYDPVLQIETLSNRFSKLGRGHQKKKSTKKTQPNKVFRTSCNHVLGSAVAVEHIFSGGWDTISLCRASLKPETIRVLMLVKHRLIFK